MFSKKATKIEKNLHLRFDTYLANVKSTVKTWSIFVAFLENINFNKFSHFYFSGASVNNTSFNFGTPNTSMNRSRRFGVMQ